jgi:hypothetical protein
MLCDTCVYKDCNGISCSECKFLRRSETLHGQIWTFVIVISGIMVKANDTVLINL